MQSVFEKEIEMKIRPLYDRILVRRLEAEEKTQGGIIIPDTAKEKPLVVQKDHEGTAVTRGPIVTRCPDQSKRW